MLKELHSVNTKEIKDLEAKYQLNVSSLSGLSFPVTTVIDKNDKISDETSRKQEGISNTSNINLMPLTSVHLSADTELFKGLTTEKFQA
ncbi:unnamed protein product, partial [Ceratitis capitata]